MSYILPFTAAVPVSLSRDSTAQSWRIQAQSHERLSYTTYNEHGVDVILRTPPIPRRKGSWLNKPRHERTQSCRRVNSTRDWSGELEESEYRLPFTVATEDSERGNGVSERGNRVIPRRIVSFQDDVEGLPRLDTLPHGLMVDVEESPVEREHEDDEMDGMSSAVGTESSVDGSVETYTSAADSEWTAFSEEAEGIEMYF
jgi:hypothetical protein